MALYVYSTTYYGEWGCISHPTSVLWDFSWQYSLYETSLTIQTIMRCFMRLVWHYEALIDAWGHHNAYGYHKVLHQPCTALLHGACWNHETCWRQKACRHHEALTESCWSLFALPHPMFYVCGLLFSLRSSLWWSITMWFAERVCWQPAGCVWRGCWMWLWLYPHMVGDLAEV